MHEGFFIAEEEELEPPFLSIEYQLVTSLYH